MATTLEDLIAGAKDLSDKEEDPSVSDTRWTKWTNDAIEALWRLVVSANPDLFVTSADFAITSGNTYAAPAGFRRLRMVERDPGTSHQRRLRRVALANRNGQAGYTLTGSTLAISPAASAQGSYRLTYLRGPTLLADNSPAVLDDVLDQWAEFVQVHAAIRALGKEESDTVTLERRLAELKTEITEAAMMHDSGEPEGIIEVDDTGPNFPWSW